MKNYIFFFLFSATLITLRAQPVNNIRIDVANSMGGPVSQIFSNVKYIPLETHKMSLFGKIDKLILTKDKFFILDHGTDAILVFDTSGKYLRKMTMEKYVKTSNRQSMGIKDFTVNEGKGEIVVTHMNDFDHLYFFNLEGRFIYKLKRRNCQSLTNIDTEHYLYESTVTFRDSISKSSGNCMITNGDVSQILQYTLPRKQINGIQLGKSPITRLVGKNTVFYTRSYDYSIYKVDKGGAKQMYKFLFPLEYSLPTNFLDSTFTEDRYKYLSNNKKIIYSVSNFYSLNQMLLFHCNTNTPNDINSSLIYSKLSQNLFSLSKVYPDSTNHYLPVYNDYQGILAADSNSIYNSLPAYVLFENAHQVRSDDLKYNEPLKIFFKAKNLKSNPVIVKLELSKLL